MATERLRSIGEGVSRVHDHLMKMGPFYGAVLGVTSFEGGIIKGDSLSVIGGYIVAHLAILVIAIDAISGSNRSKDK